MERTGGGFWHETPRPLRPLQSLLGRLTQFLGRSWDDERWLKLHEDRLMTLIRRYGSDSGPATTARADIATRLERLGRFDEARLLREEILAAYQRNRGNDDRYTLVQEEWLVHDLWALELRDEARELALHVHEVRTRDLGASHEETLRSEALLRSINEG